jgi:hypothetical protein
MTQSSVGHAAVLTQARDLQRLGARTWRAPSRIRLRTARRHPSTAFGFLPDHLR